MKTTHTLLALALVAVAMVFASCSKDNGETAGPTQQEIETKIIGSWKDIQVEGRDVLTNNRMILSFEGNHKSVVSCSFYVPSLDITVWGNRLPSNYNVTNQNLIFQSEKTLYGKPVSLEFDFFVNKFDGEIMNTTLLRQYAPSIGVDDNKQKEMLWKIVTADYSKEIVGLWEGVSMTGDETYGNAEARIAYHADGTFTYYKKYADVWFPSDDVSCEYNVDGDWLATRWCPEEGADYNYEWWDIDEIKDGTMKWSALRERTDGSRYTTTFTWKKVNEPMDDELLAKAKGEWEQMDGTEYLFTDGKLVEQKDFTVKSDRTLSITDDNMLRFIQLDEDGNPYVVVGCRFTVKGTLITFAIEEAPYPEWIGETGRYVWFFLDDDTLAVATYEKEYNSGYDGLVIARYKRK